MSRLCIYFIGFILKCMIFIGLCYFKWIILTFFIFCVLLVYGNLIGLLNSVIQIVYLKILWFLFCVYNHVVCKQCQQFISSFLTFIPFCLFIALVRTNTTFRPAYHKYTSNVMLKGQGLLFHIGCYPKYPL